MGRKRNRSAAPEPDAEINLRGTRLEEAMSLLASFLQEARMRGDRRVRIIHGKGIQSPDGVSVVRRGVANLLEQAHRRGEVRDYRLGNPGEGGAGVTIVWL